MKTVTFLLFFLGALNSSYAQTLDENIKSVSEDLASKASKKHITHLGLIDFKNEEDNQDPAVKYIQGQVEMSLINAPDLQIMDREHIVALLGENKLVSQGLIDESSIKKSVSFTKIDGWVVGKITNSGGQFKLTLKVIDINSSQTFAASESGWIDASELNKILLPKPCQYCKGTGTIKTYEKCAVCNGTGGPKCNTCGGSGRDFISTGLGGSAPCNVCKGKGRIQCQGCAGKGQTVALLTCNKCNGTGKRL